MRASELQDRIVRALVRAAGGSPRRWRVVLGPIRIYDIRTHPHCNWSVAPSGEINEVARIERLLDTLRLEYPIVGAG
jgi:hypothetical protein